MALPAPSLSALVLFATATVASTTTAPRAHGDGPFAGLEHTRRGPSLGALWQGLGGNGTPSDRGPVASIVALREPLERRVRIGGGKFMMGSTPKEMQAAIELCAKEPRGMQCRDYLGHWIRAEGALHEVTLSEFDIDRTEVTVERYARCVSAGACSPPSFPAGDPRYDRPTFPVTHVRFQDAAAYCAWSGGRLPTEAEWEYAARGRAGRQYPWGELYNPHLANHGTWADDPSDGRDGFVDLAPVGSFPDGATASGLLDMAGNAAEWVADWYELDDNGFGYRGAAQTNPKGPNYGAMGHVVRGGSYRDGAHWLRNAARRPASAASREIGFRCAWDVAPPGGPT